MLLPVEPALLLAAAEEYGTPLYLYDLDKIASQYRRLIESFKGVHFKVKYACKANTNLSVLRHLLAEGCGVDAVSLGEVMTTLKAGFQPQDILFTPNSVAFQEVQQAVELGVHINIDNISILEHFGAAYGDRVPVCLRINPHVLAGGNSHIQTGHIDSKFGISIHQLRHALRVIKGLNIRVEGLHMHTGSDILNPDAFLNAFEILLSTAEDFPQLKYLDFGSGFKVPYKQDDISTNVEELGPMVVERFSNWCHQHNKNLELWCEPGKFLVSEAGLLLVRANVIKQTVSTVFVGVDSGLNHLLRPMLYDAYHHIVNISNPKGPARIYSVVGNICETDTLGWDRKINEVREGDILAIQNAGAYGFSMSSQYNSRLRPAEVVIKDGETILSRRRETFEDLWQTQMAV